MSTNANLSEPKTWRENREKHRIVSQKEWLVARKELLEAEKELTRRSDELARRRQELPWVRVDKAYRFETDEGSASLADLFSLVQFRTPFFLAATGLGKPFTQLPGRSLAPNRS